MQKLWRLCLCLAALFWLLGLSHGVQAHALLLAAEPPENGVLAQSPGAIQLWFTEPVEPNFTEVVLRAADGSVQQTGKPNRDLSDPAYVSVSLPALREGVYSVTWKVLSQLDGHITNGTYAFAVGSGDPTALSSSSTASANLPEALARWLMASGLALVLGSLTFPLLVWRTPLPPADNRSWQRMQWLGCGLLLLAALGGLWAQSNQLNGEQALQPAALGQLLLATRWGWLWLLRLAAIAWLAINMQSRLGKVLVGVAALGFLLVHSFSTHAASVGILWLGVTTSVLHIATVSVWLGGLVGLLYQLPRLRALPLSDRWEMLAVAIGRFSPLGLAAVGLLSLSGGLTAWQTVGGVAALQGSSYGNALLLKLGVVLVIVLVAAYNLLVIKPGIARRRAQPQQSTPDLINAMRQAVFVEVGLGLGILGLAALVASLPFPNVQPRQMRFQSAAEDLQLQLQIIPGASWF
jgi:copper transport protein